MGAPVAHRDWIISSWYQHAVVACATAGVEVEFIVAAHRDDPTPAALERVMAGRHRLHVVEDPVSRSGDHRDWGEARYAEMACIRNGLLRAVRSHGPDLFLSLDSDVLLHQDALERMIPLLDDRFDAVGSACFLTRPPSFSGPNFGMLTWDQRVSRGWEPNVTGRVDVLMAIKLMSPSAYNVDYRPHRQGEDCGWALGCRDAGVRLGWTSTIVSKHVMDPACLGALDPRCGY